MNQDHSTRRKSGARTRLLAMLIAIVGLTAAAQAQSQDEIANRFVGAWRLVSYAQRLVDGTTRASPLTAGYIIYTDTNHMCAVLTNPNRPKWKLSSPYATTTDQAEGLSAIQGADAYCSRVEVHAQEGFVLHLVEDSVRPNLVGVIRKRWFTFDGPNRVALRIDPTELALPVVDGTLIWERVMK